MFKFKDDAAEEMTKGAAYRLAGSGYVTLPVIKAVFSVQDNGGESDLLSFAADDMLRLRGKDVSFDASDGVQGVFLVASDKTETRVTSYNRIGTNVIEAYIPKEMQAGTYEVKVVTKPGTERYEKCVFSKTITVTA